MFVHLFNQSLNQAIVSSCLKPSTSIPLTKKKRISGLNDDHLLAPTPIAIKCFEKLAQARTSSCLSRGFDPHQFAYQANKSMEDAVATSLHFALSRLVPQESSASLLFVDQLGTLPSRLANKLLGVGDLNLICLWILDCLTNRSRKVKVGPHLS